MTFLSLLDEPPQSDVSSPVPLDLAGLLVLAVVGESRNNTSTLCQQPRRNVLAQDELGPQKNAKVPAQKAQGGVFIAQDPVLGVLERQKKMLLCPRIEITSSLML